MTAGLGGGSVNPNSLISALEIKYTFIRACFLAPVALHVQMFMLSWVRWCSFSFWNRFWTWFQRAALKSLKMPGRPEPGPVR